MSDLMLWAIHKGWINRSAAAGYYTASSSGSGIAFPVVVPLEVYEENTKEKELKARQLKAAIQDLNRPMPKKKV